MTKPLEALMPQRIKASWGDAILKECDCCNQYRRTIKASDGTAICSSCADSYYTDQLHHNLEIALARIAGLEASQLAVKLPDGYKPCVQRGGQQSTSYRALMTHGGDWMHKDMVIAAIRAAGGAVQGDE